MRVYERPLKRKDKAKYFHYRTDPPTFIHPSPFMEYGVATLSYTIEFLMHASNAN